MSAPRACSCPGARASRRPTAAPVELDHRRPPDSTSAVARRLSPGPHRVCDLRDRPEPGRDALQARARGPWPTSRSGSSSPSANRLDPAMLGPPRRMSTSRRSSPQAHVLPRCPAVVCHGGAGTVLGALSHGHQLVVLPQAADEFANGARVAAARAGRTLRRDELTATALRDAPTYRRAAATVAAELAPMPDASAAVPALQALRVPTTDVRSRSSRPPPSRRRPVPPRRPELAVEFAPEALRKSRAIGGMTALYFIGG